jgi:MoaA/NifB/PqqE/SkfB family radical SAM enzyme
MSTDGTSRDQGPGRTWKFSEILADPEVRPRWDTVRRWFFLRESTYDMTSRCNIRCEGCYYFEGEKQFAEGNTDPGDWRELMARERERGITFVVLAGAEPALVPELLVACHREIPLGAIATNGLRRIPEEVGYRVHISVWGSDATSLAVRGADRMLERQIANYREDPRAVFVYTFTRKNIAEVREVARILAGNGCRFTFNMFSAPVGYQGDLRHTPSSLAQTREAMLETMERHPEHLLYSHYNVLAHTHESSLHDLFQCSYPRMNPREEVGLGRTFRQYRADLTWDRDAACCVPDTDCADCRHYASGSAVVTARLFRHAKDPGTFRAWLDYVDTYLAVWVMNYEKGENLCTKLIEPPGKPLPGSNY